MSDILVTALKRGPKAVERAQAKLDAIAEKERLAEARARRLAVAHDALNKEKQAKAERDKRALADKSERDLREQQGEPHAVLIYGNREYYVNLGVLESLAAGTAQEAVRRIVFQIRQAWAEQVVGSRAAGHPVEPKDFWPEMATSSHGVEQAVRMGLVAERPLPAGIAVVEMRREEVIEK
jgi:hypothetical protein